MGKESENIKSTYVPIVELFSKLSSTFFFIAALYVRKWCDLNTNDYSFDLIFTVINIHKTVYLHFFKCYIKVLEDELLRQDKTHNCSACLRSALLFRVYEPCNSVPDVAPPTRTWPPWRHNLVPSLVIDTYYNSYF